MRPINPYIVGNAIKEQARFFGRQDIFREVMQVLRQRESHAIVLYGQRRIGKTSMLLQLEHRLAQEGEFTPIYFDLQDKASKSLPELLYELAQYISRVTGYSIQQPADFNRTGDYFRDTFLPAIASKVANGGLVLLFDEFDVLDSPALNQASQAFFPYLRTWMENVQKIKFVFVIGRRPEELSIRSMATFKGIQSTRVSFMSRKDTEAVIRQSETSGVLQWEPEAVEQVYALTHGHPYFTQLLCSVVWENNHEEDEDPKETLTATRDEVDMAVNQALKMGANAFSWLWEGLPPAERVIISAMAEVRDEIITQEQLVETLNQSGVRLIARELELAPETLMDWELLDRVDESYRFAVPLLRKWVLANRPLRRVKDELDRLDPLADTLFQAGQGFYNNSQPENAEPPLRQALNINPNHLKARLLLGRILLDQARLAESVEVLETAYQYDERSARADLLKSLLALAESQVQDENKQLESYERILTLQPDQPLAREKRQTIWVKRGDLAFEKGDFDQAAKAYETVSHQAGLEKITSTVREKNWNENRQRSEAFFAAGQWQEAIAVCEKLLDGFPEKNETIQANLHQIRIAWRDALLKDIPAYLEAEDWRQVVVTCDPLLKEFPNDPVITGHIQTARDQMGLAQRYHEALGALEAGESEQARKLLSKIVSEGPSYKKASLKLVEAMYGKVKISLPVPSAARLLTFLTSLLWTTIVILGLAYWIINTLFSAWSERNPFSPSIFLYTENVILLEFILVPLIGILLSLYANNVIDLTHEIERGKFSFGKALWTHALYGMGLFYVDRFARRKWFYAIVAFLIPGLIVAQIIYIATTDSTMLKPFELSDGSRIMENWEIILIICLNLYGISFVDVLFSAWARIKKKGASKKPQTDGKRDFLQNIRLANLNLPSGGWLDWAVSIIPWLPPTVMLGILSLETKLIWEGAICIILGILVTRWATADRDGYFVLFLSLFPFIFGANISYIFFANGLQEYQSLVFIYLILTLIVNLYWVASEKGSAYICISAAVAGMISVFATNYLDGALGFYEMATLPLVASLLFGLVFIVSGGIVGAVGAVIYLALALSPLIALYVMMGGIDWNYNLTHFFYSLAAIVATAMVVALLALLIKRLKHVISASQTTEQEINH